MHKRISHAIRAIKNCTLCHRSKPYNDVCSVGSTYHCSGWGDVKEIGYFKIAVDDDF